MANDFEARIERLLATNGVPDGAWHYRRRGKHRSVIVRHNGKDHTFIFPVSSGDVRAPKQLVAFMRRRLGMTAR
jgi:hypothetical protein